MAHTAAWRGGTASNERNNGLGVGRSLVVLLEVRCCVLLSRTADLTNEDDTLSVGVLEEDLDYVNVGGTGEGVTTDTDGERLAETGKGGLAVY